jgi:hypothetical protein
VPKINVKAVNNLCDELWNLCTRLAATSDEQVEEWTEHPEIYLRLLRQFVDPLPEHLESMVLEAMDIWKEIELAFLLKIKKDRDDFIADFVKIWNTFTKHDENWKSGIQRYGDSCRGVVWNMEWVNAFVWQLPAADPDNAHKYLRIGQMMAAIFFIEITTKSLELAALCPEEQHKVSDIRNTCARVILAFENPK